MSQRLTKGYENVFFKQPASFSGEIMANFKIKYCVSAKLMLMLACLFVIVGCASTHTSITDSSGREYYTPPEPWYDKTWNPYDPNRSKQAKEQFWEKYKEEHKFDTDRYITIYDRDYRSIGHVKISD